MGNLLKLRKYISNNNSEDGIAKDLINYEITQKYQNNYSEIIRSLIAKAGFP